MLVSKKRDLAATRQFFTQALQHGPSPTEVTTDRAPAYLRVLDGIVRLFSVGGGWAVLTGMWLCGGLGQAAVGRPTTWFQVANLVSISWR